MNKLQMVKMAISRTAGRTGLLLNKYSPEILIGVGVTGVVVSTVMACKATLKVDEIIEERKGLINKINEVKESVEAEGSREGKIEYTDEQHKRDKRVVYVQSAVKIAKVYIPSITLGVASVACILGAHGIMRRRNLALVAAYKAVEESYTKYRKRVVEEHGAEADRRYKNGIKTEIVTETKVDENGKKKKVETIVETMDPNGISMYARFFGPNTSKEWNPSHIYNLTYLKNQQSHANDLLEARGHVFLNEVYDMLGFERVPEGQVVGWAKGVGDDFVDFGIYDVTVGGYRNEGINDTIAQERMDFVNGDKNAVLLDFNVAGVVHHLI